MVWGAFAPNCLPIAKVRPSAIIGHHGQVLGPLHHRIIDRDIVQGLPRLGRKAGEGQILFCRLKGRTACGQHLGRMFGKGCKDGLGGEQENPCVPQMQAAFQQRLRAGKVGFFDKRAQGLWHRRKIRRRFFRQL